MWKRSSPIRHPLFPELKPTAALGAKGSHHVLAGTFHHLVEAGLHGVSAARAVFLVRNSGCPWVADSEREMLWRLFEVPVLGLLVNDRHEVLAYECEAQHGMHLQTACLPGPAAALASSPCSCGRPGHRLVPAARTFSAADRELPVAV
jgi:hypothetical protein